MKRSLLRRSLIMGTAFSAAAMALFNGAPPASAAVPDTQTGVVVAAAGSDTSQDIMTAVFGVGGILDGSTVTVDAASTTAHTFNIPAFTDGYKVSGEVNPSPATNNDCPGPVTWNHDPLAPPSNTAPTKGYEPFGSSAGRNYLAAENGSTGPNPPSGTETSGQGFGCVDVARSSGAPRSAGGGDRSTFEYYAFAFDAVTWATTSLKAPPYLTRDQITAIYDCGVTDWSQVGGAPGPIQRYFPQQGSGTRSFFTSDILVGKSSSYAPPHNAACPDFIPVEENAAVGPFVGGQRIGGVDPGDLDKAIIPYSVALWDYQSNNGDNPTLDRRCTLKGVCARLGGINIGTPTAPNVSFHNKYVAGGNNVYKLDTTGVVNENNVKPLNPTPSFPGVRFIYNVLDSVGTRRGYQAAKALLGFTNTSSGVVSPMCTQGSAAQQVISDFDFAPLPKATNGNFNLNPNSACRFIQGVT